MKNTVKSIALFIFAAILFSSCSNKFSLTKRHYRNGYHVEYSSKQMAKSSKPNEAPEKRMPSRVSEQKITPVVENEITASVNPVSQPVKHSDVKIVSHKHTVLSVQRFTSRVESAVNKPKVILKNNIQKITADGDSDSDARSFFWAIILLIIILWAIAFFLGGVELGGLIHLLLVIALILFILWLLRII